MNGIIWLWKHRHCWEQLKYLYEHRGELKRILSNIFVYFDRPGEYQDDSKKDPDAINGILTTLREFDRIPLARPWKISPPPAPRRAELIARGPEWAKPEPIHHIPNTAEERQ